MKVIDVAVGIVRKADQSVLINQRPDGKHGAGYWEFPGGKIEAGESVFEALRRELQEEIGIHVEAAEPLITLVHHYDDRVVRLHTWNVSQWTGEASSLEGQPLKWVMPDDLPSERLLPADKPIVNAIRLSRVLLITGEYADVNDFSTRLERALNRGVSLVRLRNVCSSEFERGVRICAKYKVGVVVDDPQWLEHDAVVGLHLNEDSLMSLEGRPALLGERWLGASCHTQAALQKAVDIGCDYALLSPVQKTLSHPQQAPLGWGVFADWVTDIPMPVYALGGMTEADLEQAMHSGGQGIAAISAYW